ncbi:hypothetical protein [Rhizobium laguerreae]|uniref:Uncharacterized protein n=1 Tax=Rhizobium laguerreae TaxID=1076926 RepID=A0A7Y2W9A5_9HYPH|nr:hypothetical protein [Rhizobium laguerreae]NNH68241.1 hypothetical protein [Rhizobium laguerreae]
MDWEKMQKDQAQARRDAWKARPLREKIEDMKGWLGSAFIAFVVFCFIFGPLVGPRTP